MNATSLRDVDFEAYERRARQLQRQAIDAAIDSALARLRQLRRTLRQAVAARTRAVAAPTRFAG